jgi:hypothetical protein
MPSVAKIVLYHWWQDELSVILKHWWNDTGRGKAKVLEKATLPTIDPK